MSADGVRAADERNVFTAEMVVTPANPESGPRFDVLVIGAGFSGLYMLHRLRQLGLRTRVLEMAENVGGTWLFNRYPGARCDIESIEYSYSFSEEIQQEWVWTESMPAQPEIEAYLNFVADRLDLRRDIQFDTKVVAMAFDEEAAEWVVRTEKGESLRAPFVVAATGILSAPLEPDLPGMDSFAGTSLFTSRWPKEGFDLAGKRVGVIGTGSTGIQLIPVVAQEASGLYVFQRSPAYTLPWRVHRFRPGELDEMKARYGEIRDAQRAHPIGAARLSAFSVLLEMLSKPALKSASREEQLRAIEENGILGALSWSDIFFDIEANRMAARLYGEAVARIVRDPQTAASLVPVHPFACKRPIIDQGYYETFNRDNVTLVDLRKSPIREVMPTGIRTEHDSYELDVIVYATGFDAMTGALSRIDVRGRDGAVARRVLGRRGAAVLSWVGRRRVPQFVHDSGSGQPERRHQLCHRTRAACGLDQRLHRPPARQRDSHHRGTAVRAAGVDRSHHRARRADGACSSDLQLLVQRRQCSRQEADVHGLCRRNTRIPAPLR